MNIFRLLGDLSHLLAIIILLQQLWKRRSCAGISGKSQILFAIVYTTRYLDLATTYISAYNTIMKVLFLAASYSTLYLIYIKFKTANDYNHDTFRIEFVVLPAVALALLIHHAIDVVEIIWTFSIYLEAVAILPQLFMIYKTGKAEIIILHYLLALGLYRAMYLLNWIYRYQFEGYYDLIAIVAGIVQTLFFCYFFSLYITKDLVTVRGLAGGGQTEFEEKVKEQSKPRVDTFTEEQLGCKDSRHQTTWNTNGVVPQAADGLISQSEGVSLPQASDSRVQRYNSPHSVVCEQGADLSVAGKAIVTPTDPPPVVKQ